MTRYQLASIALGMTTALILSSCEIQHQKLTDNEKIQIAQQKLKEARAHYLAEINKSLRLETERKLDANRRRIETLNRLMARSSGPLKMKYQRQLTAWEQRDRELRMKLDEAASDRQASNLEYHN